AVCPKARIRSRAGPGAGGYRQHDRAGGHRQEGSAGKVDGRLGRLREGQSRQAQLRLQRRRRPDALLRRAVPGAHRHQGGAYSLQGGAQSTAAVLAGEVDFSFANMTDALPQIETGLVRGLAVTSRERSPYFPDLPSVHETIIPDFVVETWNAIMAPAKTPEPIIRKMSEVLIKMADDPDAKETMRKAGASTVKTTPEQFRAQIQQEMTQWQPLIKEIADKK